MKRRSLLGLALALPAAAQAEFPDRVQAAGQYLVLNGVGSRLYSVFAVEVYRAALYLASPAGDATAIVADPRPKLIVARYRRDVPLRAVIASWEASFAAICPCPLPEDFRAWLAALPAGAEERFLFLPHSVRLEATGRAPRHLVGSDISRTLLLAWIGPAAPTEALRRGLLGGPRAN